MPELSQMTPAAALTGLERLPILQGPDNAALFVAQLAAFTQRGAIALLPASYLADLTSTTDADPGAGNIRWNNADPDAATELYVDDADADAGDHSALWASVAVGALVYLQGQEDPDLWQVWEVTAVSDDAGYAGLAVDLVGSSGTMVEDAPLWMMVQQPVAASSVAWGGITGTLASQTDLQAALDAKAASRAAVTALSIASGVVNVDCSLGDYFTLALTANVTSITFSNLPASGKACSLAIRVRQDATGSRTVALPSSFKATGGSDTAVQSAANAYTLLTLTTFDQGTRWEYAMQEVAA